MIRVKKWLDRKLNYVFTIPTILFVLGMVLFPIIYTFVLSFHSWRMSANIPWKFVGLDNYVELFSAIGMVWKLIYEPNIGILNTIIRNMNGPKIDWLGDSGKALYSLVVVDVWQWTPFVMLIISAGLTSIPLELFEAAMVDGASGIKIVFKVTLPLLRPTIYTAVLLRLIDVLKTFDIIYSMTQGGPGFATETMNILSFRQAFEFLQFGEASATLIIFFVIVMAIAALTIKLKSRTEVDL